MGNYDAETDRRVRSISMAAYKGIEPDPTWGPPERILYMSLSALYRAGLDTETGKAEKKRLVAQFDRDLQDERTYRRICNWHADFWTRIEMAADAYRKGRTLELADKFLEEVYRVPPKEISE